MNKKITNWKNKKVWLVGASDGIGAALAKKFLSEGVDLYVSSRRKEKLLDVVKGYSNATVLAFDVTDLSAAEEAIKQIPELDLVIFMAADYSPMKSDNLDAKRAGQIVDVNLKGAINISSVAIEKFLKQKRGHLSLVASVAGFVGLPESSVYGATKAALINFGESLAHDLKPLGLDISIVNPGFVKTRLTEKNEFDMPFIMTAEEAALEIFKGYGTGKFAITFPFIFSLFFRTIRVLPYCLHFKMMKALVKT
ncbi:MAG: SDR family NAD(P)-dependent oxidoreductase [Bacteriovoracaceae bacterium]|nr:SDR family NAD(P)-dependent oxidoreductase [Bacteriovoracaceae bacterium]